MRKLKFVLMAAVACVLLVGYSAPAYAQKKSAEEKQQEALRAKIAELEKKKEAEHAEQQKKADASRPTDKELQRTIETYEKIFNGCATNKKDRCAETMYELGKLYYDEGKENYAKEVKQYERDGKHGAHPAPDYSKSLRMYWQLTREYPNYPKLPDAFTMMGTTYLVAGHVDSAKVIWEQLVQRFPKSRHVSSAHFRLADLAFVDNNWYKAYEHYSKVVKNDVEPNIWEMAHYRLGECAYNIGDFDKAIDYFHSYVVSCDNGQYKKKEFRDFALEYIGISFADMPDGANRAIKFFSKNRGKPYEAQVVYMVGFKNYKHGQWDAAVRNLEAALKKYPSYKDANLARQRISEANQKK